MAEVDHPRGPALAGIAAPAIRWRRVALVLTAAIGVAAVTRLAYNLTLIVTTQPGSLGIDLALYLDATRRWLDGGSFYAAWQLSGPYAIAGAGEILYPPIALYLFVPFTVLPAILWWTIPIGLTTWAVAGMRPAIGVWPLLALLLWWPRTQEIVMWGNPAMWIDAFVAWGLLVGWPAVLVILKPSLALFGALGAWSRSWWIALPLVVVAAVPFGTMWADWMTILGNATNATTWYSLVDVPTVLIPVVAWLARRAGREGIQPPGWWMSRRPAVRSQ